MGFLQDMVWCGVIIREMVLYVVLGSYQIWCCMGFLQDMVLYGLDKIWCCMAFLQDMVLYGALTRYGVAWGS